MVISGGRQTFGFKERKIHKLAPMLDALASHAQDESDYLHFVLLAECIDEVGTSGGEK